MGTPSPDEIALLEACDADKFWEVIPFRQVAYRAAVRRSDLGHAASKSGGRVGDSKRSQPSSHHENTRSAPGGLRRGAAVSKRHTTHGGGGRHTGHKSKAPIQPTASVVQHIDTYQFIEDYRGLYSAPTQPDGLPRPSSSPASSTSPGLAKLAVRGSRGKRLNSNERWAEDMVVRITGKNPATTDNVFTPSAVSMRGMSSQGSNTRTCAPNQPFVISGSNFISDGLRDDEGWDSGSGTPVARRGSRSSVEKRPRPSRFGSRGTPLPRTSRAVGNTDFGPRFGRPLTALKWHSAQPPPRSDDRLSRAVSGEAIFKPPGEGMAVQAKSKSKSPRRGGHSSAEMLTIRPTEMLVGTRSGQSGEASAERAPSGRIVKQGNLSPHAQRRRKFGGSRASGVSQVKSEPLLSQELSPRTFRHMMSAPLHSSTEQ
eukprot:m.25947 g.25947  ORF g.25947 m.25947 type:complete len:427 (+) comp11613_c0_seq1:63-1343(+)